MALQEEFENQGLWLFRYRSFLPLLILGLGLGLFVWNETYSTPCEYEFYFELGCLAVGLLGLAVRIYTVGYTPGNTSGRNTKQGQVADFLNTTGMYSLVRHPLYVGNFLMWLSIALLIGNFWFVICFTLAYWLYYERIMFAEEQFLRRKFGESYLQWSSNLPAFIPKFAKINKPNLPFSWKKVLKKEKNGVFALFLIFSVFDYLGSIIGESSPLNYVILGGTIITALLYVVLKIIKKNTKLLNEDGR